MQLEIRINSFAMITRKKMRNLSITSLILRDQAQKKLQKTPQNDKEG